MPDYKMVIEFDCLYWHSDNQKDKNYHLNKTINCEKENIQLLHIFEDEWIYKKDTEDPGKRESRGSITTERLFGNIRKEEYLSKEVGYGIKKSQRPVKRRFERPAF